MAQTIHRTVLRLAALGALTGLAAALAFGYLGRVHMAFDSFSHFRLHIAALLALGVPLLLVLRFRIEAVFALALAVAVTLQTVGLSVAPPRVAQAQGADALYSHIHINLRFDNATPQAALSLLGSARPDVVTLNEVSEPWIAALSSIEAAWPHRLICPAPSHIGGVAILSRRPFAEGFEPFCGDRGAFAHARLDFGGRTVEVVTLHLGWPWPYQQPRQVPELEPLLARVGDTAIIGADLNAAPWSHSARRLEAAADARLLRGIGPTWLDRRLPDALRPLVGLPIDNVMVKGGVLPAGLRTLDTVGSDHLPVLLEFMLLPQEQPAQVLKAEVGSRAVGQ